MGGGARVIQRGTKLTDKARQKELVCTSSGRGYVGRGCVGRAASRAAACSLLRKRCQARPARADAEMAQAAAGWGAAWSLPLQKERRRGARPTVMAGGGAVPAGRPKGA
jgi:hypothetical protein